MYRDRNQVVLPLEIEKIIPQNDPVFKLVEICEKLDYSKLEKVYVRSWRKLNPATMFIILVYAYMRRLYSSRQIEEACKTDIRFMWTLGMESAPDHSTIARFQNEKLVPVMEDLFYQLVNQLMDMNEVSYTNVFVDGTKIEANANKYSFVWAKAVEKNLKKLEAKMETQTRQTAIRYCLKEEISFEELLGALMQLASLQNISFVYGKGKRKTQLQRDIDLLVLMGDKRRILNIVLNYDCICLSAFLNLQTLCKGFCVRFFAACPAAPEIAALTARIIRVYAFRSFVNNKS